MAKDKPPENGDGLAGKKHFIQERMEVLAQKALGEQRAKSLPVDPEFSNTFPFLWEWMTATQIGDAFLKDAPKLTFSVEDGGWKATLSDNALRCSLSAMGNTAQDALLRLDRLIVDHDAPWVIWKRQQKPLREIKAPEEKSP